MDDIIQSIDGSSNGYWENHYSNGALWYRGTYKNGKRHGYWETFHRNGRLMYRGTYKNGRRCDYWEIYADNGISIDKLFIFEE